MKAPNLSKKQRQSGISLVEVLIGLGIIVVLGTLLLSGLDVARAGSERAKCASNLRTLGSAIHSYAADNGGYLPRGSRGGASGFVASLVPYVGPMKGPSWAPDAFYCPTNVRLGSPPATGYENNYKAWGGYALNYYFNASVFLITNSDPQNSAFTPDDQSRTRLIQFSRPSITLALSDSKTRIPRFNNPPTSAYVGPSYFNPKSSSWGFGMVHQGKSNLLMLDGHVEAVGNDKPLSLISLPDNHRSFPGGPYWP